MNNLLIQPSTQKRPSKNVICAVASAAMLDQVGVATTGLHCNIMVGEFEDVRPALVIFEMGEGQVGTAEQLIYLRAKWPGVQVLGLASWQNLYDGKLTPSCVVDDLLFLPATAVDLQYRIRRHLTNQLEVSSEDAVLTFGVVRFDLQSLVIHIADKKLTVTKREYELLLYFARQSPRHVTHKEIAEKVLKLAQGITTYDNVINVHIARVRAKLKEISEEQRLKTLRGRGFLLDI